MKNDLIKLLWLINQPFFHACCVKAVAGLTPAQKKEMLKNIIFLVFNKGYIHDFNIPNHILKINEIHEFNIDYDGEKIRTFYNGRMQSFAGLPARDDGYEKLWVDRGDIVDVEIFN